MRAVCDYGMEGRQKYRLLSARMRAAMRLERIDQRAGSVEGSIPSGSHLSTEKLNTKRRKR